MNRKMANALDTAGSSCGALQLKFKKPEYNPIGTKINPSTNRCSSTMPAPRTDGLNDKPSFEKRPLSASTYKKAGNTARLK